jgi:hypothetical protein
VDYLTVSPVNLECSQPDTEALAQALFEKVGCGPRPKKILLVARGLRERLDLEHAILDEALNRFWLLRSWALEEVEYKESK